VAFVKRTVAENFISLGDGEGDVKSVGGILTKFVENRQFAKPKTDYEFVDKDGKLQVLSGSASLARQIHADDMGKFFKATFEGWGKSNNGNFKQIAVYIWDGEPTEVMKQWPKFDQYYRAGGQPVALVARDFEKMPAAIQKGEEEDDGLPF